MSAAGGGRGVSVLLAEDHQVVRRGLYLLVEAESDLSVVGETHDGLEVLRLVERLAPGVLLLDLMLPGLNGLEVTRQVARKHPGTRILILSMHSAESYVLAALRNGAAGYVLKSDPPTEVVKAIHAVAAGKRYLSPALSDRAIEAYLQSAPDETSDRFDSLSGREREVLQLLAEGNSNAEMARRLFISSRTVETHRANVMKKLALSNQSELVRFAIRRGIIPLED